MAVCLVLMLFAMMPGRQPSVIAQGTGQSAWEKVRDQTMNLTAARDCEQLKVASAPKILKTSTPGFGGCTPDQIHDQDQTARAPRVPPLAPRLRKAAWVGIIVLRI